MFFVQGLALIFTTIYRDQLNDIYAIFYIAVSSVIAITGPVVIYKLCNITRKIIWK